MDFANITNPPCVFQFKPVHLQDLAAYITISVWTLPNLILSANRKIAPM